MPKFLTKTDSTVREYQKKWRTIIKRIGENADDEELISYFNQQKTLCRKSTFKMYRTAAVYILTEQGLTGLAQKIKSIQYIQQELPPASSSNKRKSLTVNQYERLLIFIGQKKSFVANLSERFIRATLHTGLRPIEWASAKLSHHEGYSILTVHNAKFTNGRASGEIRELRIENEETIESAARLIGLFSTMGEKVAKAKLAQCANFIRLASIEHLGARFKITPYTLRHQYTANAKKIFSKEKVALAVGHNVTKTASTHYGKKSSAWSDSDLKRVMTHNMNQNMAENINIQK